MWNSRIRLRTLASVCRSLSTLLASGVGIVRAFEVVGRKEGDSRCQAAMREITSSLRQGSDVASALRHQGTYFPDLMIQMVEVAERTGSLPEVLLHLAEHYERNVELRKSFLSAIAWPAFQFVAAILVVALLILVLGLIAESRQSEPLDVLGLGLAGPTGAVIWLVATFGTAAVLFALYMFMARTMRGRRFLDPLLMRVPVLGRCMQSFAVARFSWAFYLTQQSGIAIDDSLSASLRATANGAFVNAAPRLIRRVKAGDDLTTALRATNAFPEEFVEMVDVGETSGTVPETLHRLSPQFQEDARRSLTALTTALGWLVWTLVAIFIIFLIFRVASWYVGMLNDALQQTY